MWRTRRKICEEGRKEIQMRRRWKSTWRSKGEDPVIVEGECGGEKEAEEKGKYVEEERSERKTRTLW